MKSWTSASTSEMKQFEAIAIFLKDSPRLLEFLFDPDSPRLNGSPEDLLDAARGFCSGDYLLVRLALELWCCEGFVSVHELLDAEPEVLALVLQAFRHLAPKPVVFNWDGF
jgi:hypothetical protein